MAPRQLHRIAQPATQKDQPVHEQHDQSTYEAAAASILALENEWGACRLPDVDAKWLPPPSRTAWDLGWWSSVRYTAQLDRLMCRSPQQMYGPAQICKSTCGWPQDHKGCGISCSCPQQKSQPMHMQHDPISPFESHPFLTGPSSWRAACGKGATATNSLKEPDGAGY